MILNEEFLSYIWQFQSFSRENLTVSSGERLQIIHPGTKNTFQGPDFSKGIVEIDNIRFIGNIELHMRSSDWYRHGHQRDQNYSNVILHVVWENDRPDEYSQIPLVELKGRVPLRLIDHYQKLVGQSFGIPCAGEINKVPPIIWEKWKERLIVERLQDKGGKIRELKISKKLSWEEASWQMVARYFGGPVNGEAFQMIAEILELRVLYRYQKQFHRLEALMMGTAGLLEGVFQDHYPVMLQKEYEMLYKKHTLKKIMAPIHFLRMRPSGFPTIRISQLAGLIYKGESWISLFSTSKNVIELRERLSAAANDYWNNHYLFDRPAPHKVKYTGNELLDSLIINVAIPVRYALGCEQRDTQALNTTIEWLLVLPAEKNHRLDEFVELGLKPENSGDSQALLQLKSNYCDQKNCLKCAIGNHLLKGFNNRVK